jgi:solute:Na+ symporter, SSS family
MLKWLIIVGSVYISILFFLSWRSRRKIKSNEDFMMAGSNIGLVLGFMTFAATLFSTFTLMGMPDFSRTHGVGAWIFLALSDAGMVFLIVWFGYHLRKKVAQKGFAGMTGLLQNCYQNKWAGYVYSPCDFYFFGSLCCHTNQGRCYFPGASFPLGFSCLGLVAHDCRDYVVVL